MDELWTLSAHALIKGYEAGRFTPLDALESVLMRCDSINPTINAVIARDDGAARNMAQASGKRWAAGKALSPLDGVPISVKDNLLVQGMPATWGTVGLADHIADHDEVPVARLRAGGVVIFAKTNVPELTVQGYTDNRVFGATGLPFAPDLTPGGSSGGAAAAVAAGIGPLALCTDGGGSIRRPSAHAGLYGFKPGAGRVPRGAGFPAILGAFEVVGPIGRDPRDIETMFMWLANLANTQKTDAVHRQSRILYARRFYEQPVDAEILELCDHAAERLSALGHDVTTVESFDATEEIDHIWPVISAAGVAWLEGNDARIAKHMGPDVCKMAQTGNGLSAQDYAGAMVGIERMRLRYQETMRGLDILLTPTTAALSWPKTQSHPLVIDGHDVGPRGHAVFTAFANALGMPAVTLPVGHSSGGLPCGIQLVGFSGADEHLLQIGVAWSK